MRLESIKAQSAAQQTLDSFPAAAVRLFLAKGMRRTWRKGEQVVRPNQAPDSVVVALDGRFRVFITTPSGHEIFLRWLQPREMLGMTTLIGSSAFPVTVVANSAASTLHIPRAEFEGVLRAVPDAALALVEILSHRLAELFQMVEMGTFHSLAERVWFSLQRLTEAHGVRVEGVGRRLQITQSDLAMASGASRQRVHLELKQLERDGKIALAYGSVTLLDEGKKGAGRS